MLGAMEKSGDDSILTALALRGNTDTVINGQIGGIRWNGRWALISQDTVSVFKTAKLALIPFDEGEITLPYPSRPFRSSAPARTIRPGTMTGIGLADG